MAWNQYSKEAETGTGGDVPDIPDDLWDARVADVSEPITAPDPFKEGEEKTQFYVVWELLSDELPKDTTVRQYISLPPMYLDQGILGEKSNLWKVMNALGFDMAGRFKVEPEKWVDMRARVMTDQPDKSKFAKVTDVKPARAQRQAVGAGARNGGGLRNRLNED